MRSYCDDQLKKGRYRFSCPDPKCSSIWEYVLVRHVAGFDDATRSEIEKRVAENNIRQAHGCQQCLGCATWCTPIKVGDKRLQCPVCSRTLGRNYEFCWACQRQWKGMGVKCCGNEGCEGKDPRLRILSAAEKTTIDKVPGCPSIRACPKCWLLINWSERCRHVTCTGCKAEFCFICLKQWETVVHLANACSVAPVQATLTDSSWEHQEQRNNNDSSCVIL